MDIDKLLSRIAITFVMGTIIAIAILVFSGCCVSGQVGAGVGAGWQCQPQSVPVTPDPALSRKCADCHHENK